jgi:proteic killer suppression protein
MIQSFKHKGLKLFFETGVTKGISNNHAERLNLILARLNVSRSPDDMQLPGLKLHKLKGKLKGYYAVFVSGNWRILFKFQGEHAIEVDYLDYH